MSPIFIFLIVVAVTALTVGFLALKGVPRSGQ